MLCSMGCIHPDDEASAELERVILSPTRPRSMSVTELMQFIELEALAASCRSLDGETTLLRVLVRQQASALRHQSAPVLDIGMPANVIHLPRDLAAARHAIERRALFEKWLHGVSAASPVPPGVLSLLEAIDRDRDAPGMSGAICRQDRDLLEIGLAIERRRAETA